MGTTKDKSMDKLFKEDNTKRLGIKLPSRKLSLFEQFKGYVGITALVAGDIRMIQLEGNNHIMIYALGGLVVFFAVSAVVKLTSNR